MCKFWKERKKKIPQYWGWSRGDMEELAKGQIKAILVVFFEGVLWLMKSIIQIFLFDKPKN